MFSPQDIQLRRPVGSDAKLMLKWENDVDNWIVSDRMEVVSISDIEALIEDQTRKPFELDQLRYMIVLQSSQKCIGTADLYEIDWESDTAFIGILIADPRLRRKKAATIALRHLMHIAFHELELYCLKARIQKENIPSEQLFLKLGFVKKNEEFNPGTQEAVYIDYDIFEIWQNE